jgi:hypothetical protein
MNTANTVFAHLWYAMNNAVLEAVSTTINAFLLSGGKALPKSDLSYRETDLWKIMWA